MKNEIAKNANNWKTKVPIVEIDPSLGKYRDNTPFPEKLALTEERLKNLKIPEIKSITINNPYTPILSNDFRTEL